MSDFSDFVSRHGRLLYELLPLIYRERDNARRDNYGRVPSVNYFLTSVTIIF
ncbi:MAG: hypothetical protein U1F76_31360 [Candidatus Competibacteraceae bacterium]